MYLRSTYIHTCANTTTFRLCQCHSVVSNSISFFYYTLYVPTRISTLGSNESKPHLLYVRYDIYQLICICNRIMHTNILSSHRDAATGDCGARRRITAFTIYISKLGAEPVFFFFFHRRAWHERDFSISLMSFFTD